MKKKSGKLLFITTVISPSAIVYCKLMLIIIRLRLVWIEATDSTDYE